MFDREDVTIGTFLSSFRLMPAQGFGKYVNSTRRAGGQGTCFAKTTLTAQLSGKPIVITRVESVHRRPWVEVDNGAVPAGRGGRARD